jgi:hypothetical protein
MTTHLQASRLADIGCGARGLANGMNIPYVRASLFRKQRPRRPNNAAVTTSIIDADDGRTNVLVRRGSAMGLTEPLT